MNKTTWPWNRRMGFCFVSTLVATALADWLFFQNPWGWTLGFYQGILLVILLMRYPAIIRRAPGLLAALLGLIGALIVDPGALSILLGILCLLGLAACGRQAEPRSLWDSLRSGLGLPPRFIGRGFKDTILLLKKSRTKQFDLWKIFRYWTIPLLLTGVFALLFSVANPILGRWGQSLSLMISRWVSQFFYHWNLSRMFLWGFVAFLVWGLLRARLRSNKKIPSTSDVNKTTSPGLPIDSLTLALVLFNVLFAVQNGLDAVYLWGPVALPEGLTFAAYAHRGAYALIFTTVLAALFVLTTFKPGGISENNRWTRSLVIFWVVQNIFLSASAAWRLVIYVEAYGLTQLRLAAALWMLLVVAGLVYIGLRIGRRKSNAWLIETSALTTLGLLYVLCFTPFNWLIAWHNVRTCQEMVTEGPKLDIAYLNSLGEDSIPALLWVATHSRDRDVGNMAFKFADSLHAKVKTLADNPFGWTWWRGQLALLPRTGGSPPIQE